MASRQALHAATQPPSAVSSLPKLDPTLRTIPFDSSAGGLRQAHALPMKPLFRTLKDHG